MGNSLQKNNQKEEERACGKIFRAVTSRRVSNRNQSIDSTVGTKTRPNPDTIHVKFSESSAQTAKPTSKIEPSGKRKTVTRVQTVKTDERFTNYIKRAKLKIRAMTNLGDVMNADVSETETETHIPISDSKDSGRDQFAEYINKAKLKLRATSSTGHGNPNHDAFKRVKN